MMEMEMDVEMDVETETRQTKDWGQFGAAHGGARARHSRSVAYARPEGPSLAVAEGSWAHGQAAGEAPGEAGRGHQGLWVPSGP